MTPSEQRQMDEMITDITANLPPMLWSFFVQCKEEGFEESFARDLTIALLESMTQVGGAFFGGGCEMEEEEE
jgi:hypothetical protein